MLSESDYLFDFKRIFINFLEKTFGVDASTVTTSAVGIPVQTDVKTDEPALEEKTEFDVILQEVPAEKRVSGILAIRKVAPLGIAEAKQFVESLPKPICSNVSKEKAEEAKKILTDAGLIAVIS